MKPQSAAHSFEVAPGMRALPPGLLYLEESRTLIAADLHFAYEDVIGGALPLWSTTEIGRAISKVIAQSGAQELILLGDVIHGSAMSEGAAARVIGTLDELRKHLDVCIVAGNHEGRSRGNAVLGQTAESLQRAGWSLMHGDRAPKAGTRCIIGHLHPSLRMGGHSGIPSFLISSRVIVLPALTPYSNGLDVCSADCMDALAPWDVASKDFTVVAADLERVYPFGSLSALKTLLHRPGRRPASGFRRKFLRPDAN